MMNDLRSEIRKILSVPTFVLLFAASALFAVGTVLGAPTPATDSLTRPLTEQDFILVGAFIRIFLVLIGVRVVVDEFQHGSIVPTLTAEPRRERVLLSKALTAAVAGGLTGLVSAALLLGTAILSGHTDETVAGFGPQAAAVLGGFTAAGVLWAVLGVGLGAIIRSPVAATAGPVAYLLLIEEFFVSSVGERAATYLPGQGGFALAMAPSARHVIVGGAVLAAWALACMAAGTLRLVQGDI